MSAGPASPASAANRGPSSPDRWGARATLPGRCSARPAHPWGGERLLNFDCDLPDPASARHAAFLGARGAVVKYQPRVPPRRCVLAAFVPALLLSHRNPSSSLRKKKKKQRPKRDQPLDKMKASVLSALAAAVPALALADWPEAQGKRIKFTTVTGYFLQDETTTEPSGFDYANWNFGLLNRTYATDASFDPEGTKTQWQRFERWVDYLNGHCRNDGSFRYKVLVMGRHGEGWHNAAESFYGTPAWNCFWAEQTGNGTAHWDDPHLTPAGYREAYKANHYFRQRFEEHGMPYFDSYYSSPLTRCTVTADVTFGNLSLPADRPFAPIVKEGFREGMTVHTCNHRSNATYIQATVPEVVFEEGFTEHDELWRADMNESEEAMKARSKKVLDDVFATDDAATWVSVTAHSGVITKLLEQLGHRAFRLSTGQIIPVLVKAEVEAPTPTTSFVRHVPSATCTVPPVTSNASQGCVCPTASATLASNAPAAAAVTGA
ncbi:putative phosphoglycerate mutase [Paramyrothecium foliicola]|nr:putative phosphoglycerate mutase [Paramyrothecium foliicola]